MSRAGVYPAAPQARVQSATLRPIIAPINVSFMSDLFAPARIASAAEPLAERLRPKSIADVIGQRHLLAPGKPIALAFASGKMHSMILWGPPGVGKTTLARLMANAFNAQFIAISAVLAGVKEIRDAVALAEAVLAQSGRPTILFVDEVHRFNKAQQDAFLPFVERGILTFIGATTENPSFEVNGALLSRATVYVLEPLSADDLAILLDRATAAAIPGIAFDENARDALIAYADGDARRLINLVEQLGVATKEANRDSVELAFLEATISRSLRRSRCAARIRTPRSTGCAGCSTAAPIRCTLRGG